MKISRIVLNNYKFFDDITLETNNKNVIVLLGQNGIGKSCIFDAIFSASQMSKYKGGGLDDTYHKKDKNKPTHAKIFLEDGSLISTDIQISHIKFYGRTSYRFTHDITRNQIGGQTGTQVNNDHDGRITLNQLDSRVENDVEIALTEMLTELQKKQGKKDIDIVNSIIGPTNESLERIFGPENLQIKEIVSPLGENNKTDILFIKNKVIFNFKNLSSGEKEIFDIIFNFHRRKEKWITDGVYYIDEPELHINTKIQRALFNELVKLAKDANAQLWLATHSLGFMRGAQELGPSSIAIFEFKPEYAIGTYHLTPKQLNRDDWKRIFEHALHDLTELVTPEVIYYCEGKKETHLGNEEGFDAIIYKIIFADYYNVDFISSGGGQEVKNNSLIAVKILQKLSSGRIKIFVLKDGDHGSKEGLMVDEETKNKFLAKDPNLRMLSRRELENYLLDKSVLKKYCERNGTKLNEALISNINFIEDNLKSKVQQIQKAIGYNSAVDLSFYKVFAEIIYSEREGELKELYKSLSNDIKLPTNILERNAV